MTTKTAQPFFWLSNQAPPQFSMTHLTDQPTEPNMEAVKDTICGITLGEQAIPLNGVNNGRGKCRRCFGDKL